MPVLLFASHRLAVLRFDQDLHRYVLTKTPPQPCTTHATSEPHPVDVNVKQRPMAFPCRFITVYAICLRSYGKHMATFCTESPLSPNLPASNVSSRIWHNCWPKTFESPIRHAQASQL